MSRDFKSSDSDYQRWADKVIPNEPKYRKSNQNNDTKKEELSSMAKFATGQTGTTYEKDSFAQQAEDRKHNHYGLMPNGNRGGVFGGHGGYRGF